MKPRFGVKLVRPYFPSIRWIGANLRSDGALMFCPRPRNLGLRARMIDYSCKSLSPSRDPDSLGGIIRAATRAAQGPPNKAGEEKWLTAFLTARKNVLLNAADPETRAVWKKSAGRVNEQLRLLKERNLQLSSPLTLNPFGTTFTLNCATRSSSSPGKSKTQRNSKA
jgi:hypothetical protein